mmetsp:Transcript_41144/g.88813  ORF Transcript_41144/g.88813 Transcript_41144/m.88813 type:complete len:241 (+) Transcript_41144:1068-1790(+)
MPAHRAAAEQQQHQQQRQQQQHHQERHNGSHHPSVARERRERGGCCRCCARLLPNPQQHCPSSSCCCCRSAALVEGGSRSRPGGAARDRQQQQQQQQQKQRQYQQQQQRQQQQRRRKWWPEALQRGHLEGIRRGLSQGNALRRPPHEAPAAGRQQRGPRLHSLWSHAGASKQPGPRDRGGFFARAARERVRDTCSSRCPHFQQDFRCAGDAPRARAEETGSRRHPAVARLADVSCLHLLT